MSTRALTTRLAGHYVYVHGESRSILWMLRSCLTFGSVVTAGMIAAGVWLFTSLDSAWPALHDVIFFIQNI